MLQQVWEFNFDIEKLDKLSLADLVALEGYIHQRGEGKTNNFSLVDQAIKIKTNELK